MNITRTAIAGTSIIAAAFMLTACANPAPPISDVTQTTTPMTQDSELHFEMPHIELANGPANQLTLETTITGDTANANISLATIPERTYTATSADGRQATFVHRGPLKELDRIDLPGLTSGTTTVPLPVTVQGFSSDDEPCVGESAALTADEIDLCALDVLGIASTAELASIEPGPLTLTLSRDFGLGNGTAQVRFSDQGAAPESKG